MLQAFLQDLDYLFARQEMIACVEDDGAVGDGGDEGFRDAKLAAVHHYANVLHPGFECGYAFVGKLALALPDSRCFPPKAVEWICKEYGIDYPDSA